MLSKRRARNSREKEKGGTVKRINQMKGRNKAAKNNLILLYLSSPPDTLMELF